MIIMLYPGVGKPVSVNPEINFISTTAKIDYYDEPIISVVPNTTLRNEWLKLLLKRYPASLKYDDYREYSRAKEHYQEDITRIINDNRISAIVIDSIDYNIEELISEHMEKKDE